MINCHLTDIPSQMYGVIWTPATNKSDGYTLKNGIFDPEKKFQVSTLTISAVKLFELWGFAKSHTFTCKIIFGSRNSTVSDTQTITIFDPGKSTILRYHITFRQYATLGIKP